MTKFFYLDVSLDFEGGQQLEVDAVTFKTYICTAIRTLFGDFGASITVDLLKYNQETRRGIIRCPAKEYVKIPSNITMSVCKREGKDIIIFASKEDHDTPSKVLLPELEPQPGLIFPNGDINWNCPCLGGMATGPCGVEFREAFSCFHYSEADPKGSDCVDLFKDMQSCMSLYPALYDNKDGKDDDEDGFGENMGMSVDTNSSPTSESQPDKTVAEVASSESQGKN